MNKPYALIIHNSSDRAGQYARILVEAGFTTHVETTGARAQVQLAFTNPNLIVLALNLPDVPGEVVLRQIRAQHRLHGVCLVLVLEEGRAAEDHRREADLTVISGQIDQFTSQLKTLDVGM